MKPDPTPRYIRALGLEAMLRSQWPIFVVLAVLIVFVVCYTIAARKADGNDRLNGVMQHYIPPHVTAEGASIPGHYHRLEATCTICRGRRAPQQRPAQPANQQPSVYANPGGGSPQASPASSTPATSSCEQKCQAQFAALQQRFESIAKQLDQATGDHDRLSQLEGELTDAHLRLDAIAKQKPGNTIVQATADDVKKLVGPELDERDESLRSFVQSQITSCTTCPVPASAKRTWADIGIDALIAASYGSPYGAGIAIAGSALSWALRRRRARQPTSTAGAQEAPATDPFE